MNVGIENDWTYIFAGLEAGHFGILQIVMFTTPSTEACKASGD